MSLLSNYIPAFSINPNYIACYNYYDGIRRRNTQASFAQPFDNDTISCSVVPESNLHDGFLSDAGKKRLLKAIDWLLYISTPKDAWNYKLKKKFTFKINFITLTLPCKQFHSDTFIKSKMLNNFLTVLRQRFAIKHYIWRAEKQKNGNIHFHLILNEFIHHENIKNIWNKILDHHGYIEKYREAQKAFFGGKFRLRQHLLASFSASAQRKAYKRNLQNDWSSPNTTDVHSTKNIRNLRGYASKYLSKSVDIESEAIQTKSQNETLEQAAKRISEKLAVKGRLWFISQELSKLKSITGFVCSQIGDNLRFLFNKFKDKIIHRDYVDIIPVSVNELPALNCSVIFEYFTCKLKTFLPSFSL